MKKGKRKMKMDVTTDEKTCQKELVNFSQNAEIIFYTCYKNTDCD